MDGNGEKYYAPIVLFVYNRPEHTRKTIEALMKNKGASNSILYIYSDGPKEESKDAVNEVRNYIKKVNGFKKIQITLRERNMGLAASVIAGVTEVINQHGKVIVMEDDLVVTEHFLTYMNEALLRYEECSKVFAITGYSYFSNGNKKLPETYFAELTESWTWATWKDRWACFDAEAKGWKSLIADKKLCRKFDYDNNFNFSHMLYCQMEEKTIDSWAVRWAYTMFRQHGLTLYPNKPLCINVGFDGTGVHCGVDESITKCDTHKGAIQYWPEELKEQTITRKEICRVMANKKKAFFLNRVWYYLLHPADLINKWRKNEIKTLVCI